MAFHEITVPPAGLVADPRRPEVYVASADWMPRNFFRRIEVAFPVEDGALKHRVAEEILAEQQAHAEKDIHLPSPSYWPLVLSFSLPVIAFGVIYNHILIAVGGLIVLAATAFNVAQVLRYSNSNTAC